MKFEPCSVPDDLVARKPSGASHYQDCYRARVDSENVPEIDQVARLFFAGALPEWFVRLMELRNRVVGDPGFHPVEQLGEANHRPFRVGDRIGHWTVSWRRKDEIIFFESTKGAEQAFSLRVRPTGSGFEALVTTFVELRGWPKKLGYLPLRPLFRRIVLRHMDAVIAASLRGAAT